MTSPSMLEIVKGAILFEKKGEALYKGVALTTTSNALRELFNQLAAEEENHAVVLSKQYQSLRQQQPPAIEPTTGASPQPLNKILTAKVVAEISASGYEAAAISAAIELEKNSLAYYSRQAESSESTSEKKFYSWLAEWEKEHLTMLLELDQALREKIWYDNQFWPLD
jgi:rubrerythrin